MKVKKVNIEKKQSHITTLQCNCGCYGDSKVVGKYHAAGNPRR